MKSSKEKTTNKVKEKGGKRISVGYIPLTKSRRKILQSLVLWFPILIPAMTSFFDTHLRHKRSFSSFLPQQHRNSFRSITSSQMISSPSSIGWQSFFLILIDRSWKTWNVLADGRDIVRLVSTSDTETLSLYSKKCWRLFCVALSRSQGRNSNASKEFYQEFGL